MQVARQLKVVQRKALHLAAHLPALRRGVPARIPGQAAGRQPQPAARAAGRTAHGDQADASKHAVSRLASARRGAAPWSSMLGTSADLSFDVFHAVLAEVEQRQVVVVGEQPHQPVGTAAGGGIDPELGAARPGVVQPALPYLVVDHHFVDRLGQDGPFLLQARGDAQGLLGVIEPKVALGHAVVPQAALGLAGPPPDPRTAPPGSRRRWSARGGGSLGPTARPASRAVRSPAITSWAIGAASLPSGVAARIGGLPGWACWASNAPVAGSRGDGGGVKSPPSVPRPRPAAQVVLAAHGGRDPGG